MIGGRVLGQRIEDVNGEPHRITVYEGNRELAEPLRTADSALYARLERRRTMMGNSKKKTGG